MPKYKTVVTDYEGMQGHLDSHSAQGWRLFSATPDTWRKSVGGDSGMDGSPFDELDSQSAASQEYSASYYLLIFWREDTPEGIATFAEAEESLPRASRPAYED